MNRTISIIAIIISTIAIVIKIDSCNKGKADTINQINQIKLKGAEAKDSISDYYLMVRKMMAKGYDRIEAEDYTKRVMDKNDQKYFDSIYFNN